MLLVSIHMLYVRGNNCDTYDAEYYVNHLMVAILRELDGDTILYYRSKPHHDGRRHDGMPPAGLSPKNIK